MRTIKFRAWNTTDKTMGEAFSLQTAIGSRLHDGIDTSKVEYMQYTDLKDKTGKEIYEGDIARSGNGRTWEVKFGAYEHQELRQVSTHDGWHLAGEGNTVLMGATPTLEIIGNIYENPELI